MKFSLSIATFAVVILLSFSVLVSSQQSNLTTVGSDLIISDVQTKQLTATDLNILFTIENIGNRPASLQSDAIKFVYGNLVDTITFGFLLASSDKDVLSTTVKYDSTATKIDSIIDPNNRIKEVDESNNDYTYTIPTSSQQSNLTTPAGPNFPTTPSCGDDYCQNLVTGSNELDSCPQDCGSPFTLPIPLQNLGIPEIGKIVGANFDSTNGLLTFDIEFLSSGSLDTLGLYVYQATSVSSGTIDYSVELSKLGLTGSVSTGDIRTVELSGFSPSCGDEIKIGLDVRNPSTAEGTILSLFVDNLNCGSVAISPTLTQPTPPANLGSGWTVDANGDGWLVVDFEQGYNLLGSIMSLVGGGSAHPSSTIDLTTDLDVIYAIDPLQQQFIECYPGVGSSQQTQECQDFSDRLSQDPSYQPYILSIGGLASSTKSGQLISYIPSFVVPQLQDPTFLSAFFSQFNLVDGWNVIFIGPWFEGLTLNDVAGNCNFGDIYGWDAASQSFIGPTTIPLTQAASSTEIGLSVLIEANGDCTLSYGGTGPGTRPVLPPRSGSGVTTALPSLLTTPTQAPDLIVSGNSIAVSLVSSGSLRVRTDILNNGNLDTEIPDIEFEYAGKTTFVDSASVPIAGGTIYTSRTIPVGGSKTIEYTLPYDPTARTVKVTADPKDNVAEVDESNNVEGYTMQGLPGDTCSSVSDCLSYYCNYNTPRTCN